MSGSGRRFLEELQRRKVIGPAAWYLGAAFVVMQVVEAVFPYAGLPDTAGSAVLAVLTVGFPVALILSWVFDVSPPTFKREASHESLGHVAPLAPVAELRKDSVVVLPFENLSDDPENAYFSDGITDDIIAAVAHIDGLRVVSRTSSMQYKGVNRSVGAIAADLGVGTVVTGSVRRSGSTVRVMAQVIDASSDDHLWTETYDRELQDIFHVQSEVAANVGRAVQQELTDTARKRIHTRGTEDPEAYDLYLRARYLWNRRAATSVAESIDLYQRALERDPTFALAHAGLADAYLILGIYGVRPPGESMEAARSAADDALRFDEDLGEAVAVRGCVDGVYDWSWASAERRFLRALELSPSYATAHQWYATNLLVPHHRFAEAHDQLSAASSLDPGSGAIAASQAIVTLYSRDTTTARTMLERLVDLHPRFALLHQFLGRACEQTGDLEAAIPALRSAVELSEESSETLSALGHALARSGQLDEARSILLRLKERSRQRYVSPALLAQICIGLDQEDDALSYLEEAVELRATDLIWLGVKSVYDPIRESPRFQAILATMDLPAG